MIQRSLNTTLVHIFNILMKRQSKMPQMLLLSFNLLFCILTEIFSKQNEDFFCFNGDFLPSKEIKITFLLLVALWSTQMTFRSLKPTKSKSKSQVRPPTSSFGWNFEFDSLNFSRFTSKNRHGHHILKQQCS
jgi:hypothetical protein